MFYKEHFKSDIFRGFFNYKKIFFMNLLMSQKFFLIFGRGQKVS